MPCSSLILCYLRICLLQCCCLFYFLFFTSHFISNHFIFTSARVLIRGDTVFIAFVTHPPKLSFLSLSWLGLLWKCQIKHFSWTEPHSEMWFMGLSVKVFLFTHMQVAIEQVDYSSLFMQMYIQDAYLINSNFVVVTHRFRTRPSGFFDKWGTWLLATAQLSSGEDEQESLRPWNSALLLSQVNHLKIFLFPIRKEHFY